MTTSAKVKAVIFDLDDTLIAESSASNEAVVPWARQAGLSGSPADIFSKWRAISSRHYREYQSRHVTFAQQRRNRVREFLPHLDLHDDAAADGLFDGYLQRYEKAWRCFDDAIPCLGRLRASGITVGVLTNGEEAQQRKKIKVVGLKNELDFIVATSGLPASKPDQRAFLAACRAAGQVPANCLMVGNDPVSDVVGAIDSGMRGLLLARTPTSNESTLPSISGLEHLEPRLLKALASPARLMHEES